MKTKIIHVVYLLIILLFGVNNGMAQISRSEAYSIVLSSLGDENVDSLRIFSPKQQMPANTPISMMFGSVNSPDYVSWMFYIDKEPVLSISHECRILFVGDQGEIEIKRMNDYPSNPSVTEMIMLKDASLPIDTTQTFVPFEIPSRSARSAYDPTKYAVIISGGLNIIENRKYYWNNCSLIYKTLVDVYNYDPANIFVLMSDGTNPANDRHDLNSGVYDSSPLDLDGNGTPDIQYAATLNNIEAVLSHLKSALTPNDYLFIYTTDHGGIDPIGEVCLGLWDNSLLYANLFAYWVNQINAKAINIVMGQCHSGGFASYFSQNPKVCITTSCLSYETSKPMNNLLYSEFLYYWTEAVTKRVPAGGHFVADENNDLCVTALEAFSSAASKDTQDETPYISYMRNDLLGCYLGLSGLQPKMTQGIISVELQSPFSYPHMDVCNLSVPSSRRIDIKINFPLITYDWTCASGNPQYFIVNGVDEAAFKASQNSVSPIVITAVGRGTSISQTFRFFINPTYAIYVSSNSSTLSINMEGDSTKDLGNEGVVSRSASSDTYSLYDSNGVLHKTGMLSDNNSINISDLNNGIYSVVITNADQISQRKQIVVRR